MVHAPTILSTAFTAAALIASANGSPLPSRRGSVVDEILTPSRRGSVVEESLKSPSRRGSFVEEPASLPNSRRGSLAAVSPADIVNARRRASLAPAGLPEGLEKRDQARRSSLQAGPADVAAARRRSFVEDPLRRASIANDIMNARRRTSAADATVPAPLARRSALAVPEDPLARRSNVAEDIVAARARANAKIAVKVTEEQGAPQWRGATAESIFAARGRGVFPPAPSPQEIAPEVKIEVEVAPEDTATVWRGATAESIFAARSRGFPPAPVEVKVGVAVTGSSHAADIFAARRRGMKLAEPLSPSDSEPEEESPEPEQEESDEESAPTVAAIPLFKRERNPLASVEGVVNWGAADAHLDHISIKYEKGIVAHQVNTGTALPGAKLYSPGELAARQASIEKRAEATVEDELDNDEDSLPTIEEAFMAMAGELSVPNPKAIGRSTAKRGGGVKLQSYNDDLLWAGPVTIGTPGQPFNLDFDTGSADTWIPSVNCKTSACAKHNKYDPSKSSTSSEVEGGKLSVQYGDGSSTTGDVYSDVVTVAGVTASKQSIGVANHLSDSFANDPMDGIMGMGYQSISQMDVEPFFQTLMKENKVSTPQFSFALNSGSGSELFLGGANPNKYTGNIEWHPVTSQSYWTLQGDAYVGNTVAAEDFHAIIDTGTTVVVAPTKDADEFWSNVEGSAPYGGGYYTFPCASEPEVSFSFGNGKKWEMSKENLNLGSTYAGSSQCVGSVVGKDVGISAWIVGDSFLKDVYTSFDLESNSVGFAEVKKQDNKE